MPDNELEENDHQCYSIVSKDTPLSQGDFIDGLKVYFPLQDYCKENGENVVFEYDVVVMTQSCDLLELKDDDLVILCPRTPFSELFKNKNMKDAWVKLKKGRFIHNHLINKCDIEGYEFDFQVIILDSIISMRFQLLKEQLANINKDRVRMLSPNREFMSQVFALQFMRIGLPNSIPEICPY